MSAGGYIEVRQLASSACLLWFHDRGGKVVVEQLEDGETLMLWHLHGCMPDRDDWWQVKEMFFPEARRVCFERLTSCGQVRTVTLALSDD
jgi:hypothetical protein